MANVTFYIINETSIACSLGHATAGSVISLIILLVLQYFLCVVWKSVIALLLSAAIQVIAVPLVLFGIQRIRDPPHTMILKFKIIFLFSVLTYWLVNTDTSVILSNVLGQRSLTVCE